MTLLLLAGCANGQVVSPSASGTPASNLPNGLVDIGGRKLEMYCRGSGPVVILEAGLGNTADVWSAISTRVDSFATVCAYNRAGLGQSDARPEPHGAQSAADDLQSLLQATGLTSPYVIVGASYGGLVAQFFAREHPTEIAGVVLVDSLAAGWDDQLEAILSPAQVADRRAIPNIEPITNEQIRESERTVEAAPPFPSVPLVVLRHGVPFPGAADWPTDQVEALWTSLQQGLAALSPQSVLLVAAESGHRIHQDQPDLVTDAIHAIVDPTRWPPSAPPPPAAFGEGASTADLTSITGLLAFAKEDGIHVARGDGSADRLVVPQGDALVGEPSLDAGGHVLAYTIAAPTQATPSGPQPGMAAALWLLSLDGGDARELAPQAGMPAVSPDGASVAFVNAGHTYLIGADATGLRDLGEAGCPIWSPDSTQLALCRADGSMLVLRLADLTQHPLLQTPGLNNPTAWSPDGTSLAIFSTRDGNGEIYVTFVNAASERRLTDAPGNQFAQAWTTAGLLVTSSLPAADVSDWFLVDPSSGSPGAIPWLHGVAEPIGYAPGG